MTETLIEKVYRVAEITVWFMESRVVYYQGRIANAEGMIVRGTGTVELVERHVKTLGRIQADLAGLREAIDQFNVTLQESGLSETEYVKQQRNLARTIIGYNKSYGP